MRSLLTLHVLAVGALTCLLMRVVSGNTLRTPDRAALCWCAPPTLRRGCQLVTRRREYVLAAGCRSRTTHPYLMTAIGGGRGGEPRRPARNADGDAAPSQPYGKTLRGGKSFSGRKGEIDAGGLGSTKARSDDSRAAREPDVKDYNSQISTLGKEGKWRRAIDLFDSMPSSGIEQNEVRRGSSGRLEA